MTPADLQTALVPVIDAIHTGAWAVVGSIWALIFAVTWKG